MRKNSASGRLRAGIVGGGQGSFIGAVHRFASELDGQAELIVGAMSADPYVSELSAQAWFLKRSYTSFEEMAEVEAQLEEGIDYVIIATPNHLHYPVAKTFLECGIHVVSDKPMTVNVEEAQALVQLVKENELIYALTHNITGYPAVRQARELVCQGEIGAVRKVIVEYLQDWLIDPAVDRGKQAVWRVDPRKAGMSGCVADIGTHIENLLEFITDLRVTSLCADLTTFMPGRLLDDDANMLLRLENGSKGIFTCSQIAAGEDNHVNIRVYGDKASLEWSQAKPNNLIFKSHSKPKQIFSAGATYMGMEASEATRLPAGHPEGFIEAFANVYKMVIADIRRLNLGIQLQGGYPTVQDGLRGMLFIAKAIESSQKGSIWVEIDH